MCAINNGGNYVSTCMCERLWSGASWHHYQLPGSTLHSLYSMQGTVLLKRVTSSTRPTSKLVSRGWVWRLIFLHTGGMIPITPWLWGMWEWQGSLWTLWKIWRYVCECVYVWWGNQKLPVKCSLKKNVLFNSDFVWRNSPEQDVCFHDNERSCATSAGHVHSCSSRTGK